MTTNKDDDRSMTISEFCTAENISLSYYFKKLRGLGIGPEELRVPGTGIIRITPEARAEWHERMRELQGTREAKLETARRREQTVVAAKRSVESRQRTKAELEPRPIKKPKPKRPRIATTDETVRR